MIREAIAKVVNFENLTEKEAIEVMTEIMSGQATESQISSYITALRMKGETVEEITGSAKVMREFSEKIEVKGPHISIDRDEINIDWETIVDTCGTGGDKTHTFNISTCCAFVVAACGIVVAKHGNRAVSSKCGSADVIEALGITLDLPIAKVEECLNTIGIGFLYAPAFHSAMKYAINPRRQIGIRTIFNLLGPLTNPARATAQVIGVYDGNLTEKIANVLKKLGSKHSFVIYGQDCMDEVSITSPTKVSELYKDEIKTYTIRPEDFGFKSASLEDIKGGDAQENAQIIISILKGEKGPRRDIVVLNSSIALVASDKAKDFKEGIKIAEDAIDSGRALKKLELLKEFTKKLS